MLRILCWFWLILIFISGNFVYAVSSQCKIAFNLSCGTDHYFINNQYPAAIFNRLNTSWIPKSNPNLRNEIKLAAYTDTGALPFNNGKNCVTVKVLNQSVKFAVIKPQDLGETRYIAYPNTKSVGQDDIIAGFVIIDRMGPDGQLKSPESSLDNVVLDIEAGSTGRLADVFMSKVLGCNEKSGLIIAGAPPKSSTPPVTTAKKEVTADDSPAEQDCAKSLNVAKCSDEQYGAYMRAIAEIKKRTK